MLRPSASAASSLSLAGLGRSESAHDLPITRTVSRASSRASKSPTSISGPGRGECCRHLRSPRVLVLSMTILFVVLVTRILSQTRLGSSQTSADISRTDFTIHTKDTFGGTGEPAPQRQHGSAGDDEVSEPHADVGTAEPLPSSTPSYTNATDTPGASAPVRVEGAEGESPQRGEVEASPAPSATPTKQQPAGAVAAPGGHAGAHECDAAGIASAWLSLRWWASSPLARHAVSPWFTRALALAQLASVHNCADTSASPTNPGHFLVLVRVRPRPDGSDGGRAGAIRRTWGGRATAMGARVLFVVNEDSDNDAEQGREGGEGLEGEGDVRRVRVARGRNVPHDEGGARMGSNTTPPSSDPQPLRRRLVEEVTVSPSESSHTVDETLVAALEGVATQPASWWGANTSSASSAPHPSAPRWVLCVTDETWVNMDELAHSVRYVQWNVPLMVGHIHSARMDARYNDFRTFPLLHAGLLLTLPALRSLTRPLGHPQLHPSGCLWDPTVRDPASTRTPALQGAYDAARDAEEAEQRAVVAAASSSSSRSLQQPTLPTAPQQPAAGQSRVDFLRHLPVGTDQLLGRCALLLGLPQVHSYLQWDDFDHVITRSWKVDRNRAPLEGVATVARLGSITLRRGGRNATAKGGDTLETVYNATADKYAPLGVWHPDAHDARVAKRMPSPAATPWSPRVPHPHAGVWAATPHCPEAGVAEAASVLAEWSVRAHHPTARLYGKPLHPSQYAGLHPCVGNAGSPSDASHLVIVVMASVASKTVDRLAAITRTWVPTARAAGATVVLVAEAANATYGTVSLPGATDPTYAGAQNRSLYGLRHAVESHPAGRWYWLVDDDTWVNADVAVALLRHAEWRVPVVWGHVLHGNMRWTDRWVTYPSGGAGILLSRAAAVNLSASLFTAACPGGGLNDVVLGSCAWARRIPLVHTNLMQPELDTATTDDWRLLGGATELAALASMHRVFPAYTHDWLHRDLAAHRYAPHAPTPFTWKLPTPLLPGGDPTPLLPPDR